MFDLSEQNITTLLVFFGIIFILFLSMRSPRQCVREGLNTEYQKMFNNSNKVLCSNQKVNNIEGREGRLLSEFEIRHPSEEVKRISEEVKSVSEEIKKVAEEIKNKPSEELKRPTQEIIRLSEEIQRPAEEVKLTRHQE